MDSVRAEERRAAELERRLASPEARLKREESRAKFLGVSDADAVHLVETEFRDALRGVRADFALKAVAKGRPIQEFLDDRTVLLAGKGDQPPLLVESPWPVRAVDDDGEKRLVDLSLARAGGNFVPANAVADLRLPDALGAGKAIGVGPVGIVPAGVADGQLAGDGGDRVIYANAQMDTDVIVTPIETGVEVFWQLRSPRAPEELTLDLNVPEGAVVRESTAGSAVVVQDDKSMTVVRPPVAFDAQGASIPVHMEVEDARLVLSLEHRDSDVAYPILVDPIIEDYWGAGNSGSWFDQNEWALDRMYTDWEWVTFNVGWDDYAPTFGCYAPVSCDPAIGRQGLYKPWMDDGLHVYVRPISEVTYPAGSSGSWEYTPPGTTTRIHEAGLWSFYHRRGGSQNPYMYSAIASVPLGTWASVEAYTQDHAYHTVQHFAGGAPGPQSLSIGFYTPVQVANGNWRDGYIGAAILALTDPEGPTITGGTMKRLTFPQDGGAPEWVTRDQAKWVKPQDRLTVSPDASDPGLGVKKVQVIDGDANNVLDSQCIGSKVDLCDADWSARDSALEFSIRNMADGPNTVTLYAWDALGQASHPYSFPIKVDGSPPVIGAPTGGLWANKEEDNLLPEQQDVLSPGVHPVSFTATDPGAAGAASGVELLEVRVDGQVESNQTVVPCPAGGCQRSLTWNYDTAKFGGRHKIELVAYDGAGNEKRMAFYVNAPSTGDLIYPNDGEITSSKIALQAKDNDDDFTAVRFEYRKRPVGTWTTIDSHLTDDQGTPVGVSSHPLSDPGRHSKKLIWDVRAKLGSLVPKLTKIQVRAVFTGAPQEFTSRVSDVDLDDKGISADNAQEPVGPGSVDLLTGNFSLSATEASLSNYGTPITVTRTFNSLDPNANPAGPFGPGWVMSAPLNGVSDYSSLVVLTDPSTRDWVDVFDSAGARIRFEKTGPTTFKSQAGFESLVLTLVQADHYTLTDLDGTTTTFVKLAGASKFVPSKVEQAGSQGTASYNYDVYLGEPRLKRVVAPAPEVDCDRPDLHPAALDPRCRILEFIYTHFEAFGAERLTAINQYASDGTSSVPYSVAGFRYWTAGPEIGRLAHSYDPRISQANPELTTVYNYTGIDNRISHITPPGEASWTIGYAADASGAMRLDSVSRTAAGSGPESWRVRYQVPLSTAAGGPYDLTANAVAAWGQTDRPTDATAILPPTESGEGYSKATVRYLNQDGSVVNAASPGGRISVAEYDVKGNVTRELSPANRARALLYPGSAQDKVDYSRTVDTQRTYSSNGLRLVEELGPQHDVKLDAGQVVAARAHTVTSYDEPNADSSTPAKPVHLPTTVTTGAKVGSNPDIDVRTTRTEYDWILRKPTKTTIDPGSGNLNIVSQTFYNSAGLTTESRQPKSNGSDAGATKTIYYGDSGDSACSAHPEWYMLPCKTKPAAQPGTAGLPDLPVTTYTYDRWGNVLTATEQIDTVSRTTTATYDLAGRKVSENVSTSGGSSNPPNGLVAAYGFEEGSGSTVGDASGEGNDGEIDGATWTTVGKFGNALNFDGIDDSLLIVDDPSIDVPTSVTVSAWVKPHAVGPGHQTILVKERGTSSGTYALHASTGNTFPEFELRPGSWYDAKASSALANNEWAHIAGSWDGQTIKLYIDGTLAASRPMTGPILTSDGLLRIGGSDIFGFYFDGLIDEVRVYNRGLSQQEIQADKAISVAEQTEIVGQPVSTTTYGYDSTSGRPTMVSTPSGMITTTYDNVGRVTGYTDVDGVTSTTSYDNFNRPSTTSDGKGTQTRSYDSNTGLLTSLTDSQAGTFTASYDDDGRILSKTYPNGMKADTTYDEAGSPVRLAYTKTSNCSSNCTWVDEQVSESIHGQWRTHTWELSSQEYAYDKAGRLASVEDDVHAPTAVEGCTIRSYAFDQNSNRTAMNTKAPATNGDCQPAAAGTSKTYSYDDADRLTGTGIQYDSFGRVTSLPAAYSNGGVLTYRYYANDQVGSIAQDGVSKTYELDPAGRQRKSVVGGGTTHTETLHYQDSSDSPSWTSIADAQAQEVSWERNIEGIDGDLAAVRTHDSQGDTTVLQLQNLHGDIVATASSDSQATALTGRFETTEFGIPRQQTGRRYGYLGGKQRRTELASGVIQMGVRNYVPALGRFTSADPVEGGSATSYDYSNADPVNQLDLDGRMPGCNNKSYKDPFVRIRIRRTGGGHDKHGDPYFKYNVSVTAPDYLKPYALRTLLRVSHKASSGSNVTGHNDSDDRSNRGGNWKRWYAHTTIYAKPKSIVRIRSRQLFSPVRLPDGSVLTGNRFSGTCRA
jgi:RHS repeat-associated protein